MQKAAGPDPGRRVRADLAVFAALLLSTVVCALLPLPFRLAGLGFGAWGAVVGVLLLGTLSRLSRAGRPARGHLGVAVGLGALSVMMLDLVSQAVFLPAHLERQECLAGAGTGIAERECEQAFRERVSG
jgi:hypothetical protein